MKYYELKVKVSLKAPLHFQRAPEAISKLIATALIKSGYQSHQEKVPKGYVFSNLGRADKDGYFKSGEFYFRTFKEELSQMVASSLSFYQDNIFQIEGISFNQVGYRPIRALISLNPVFLVLKDGSFWTFNYNGKLQVFLNALQDNLIRKLEMNFGEKVISTVNFIESLKFKNRKPLIFYYKGVKFFGYKIYFIPKEDEISQKLTFVALATGLGHKNSAVGGGFLRWLK